MGKKWPEKEDVILREHYPTSDIDTLLNLLPGRSVSAIINRAYVLRLRKEKRPKPPRPLKEKQPRPKRKVIPRPKLPIMFRPYEKQIICDFGHRLDIIELKMLLPRRSLTEIRTMAQMFGIELAVADQESEPQP